MSNNEIPNNPRQQINIAIKENILNLLELYIGLLDIEEIVFELFEFSKSELDFEHFKKYVNK